MNTEFGAVSGVLSGLKADYAAQTRSGDVTASETPITEADVVAEVRGRLMPVCLTNGLSVHCEVKAVVEGSDLHPRQTPRLDIAILRDLGDERWLLAAKEIQDRYQKGAIEARFSSIPVRFFHTVIEVKVQSKLADAKKDLDGLAAVRQANPSCNVFFLLLNARGNPGDHDRVLQYAAQVGVTVFEHTSKR